MPWQRKSPMEEEEEEEATLVDASGGGQGAEANDSPSVRKPSSSGARWTEEIAANEKMKSYGKLIFFTHGSSLPQTAPSDHRHDGGGLLKRRRVNET